MRPLDRKLLRDLWRLRAQAVAIGLVVALGVLMQVMMSGLVNSLEETRRAYYERYRLADVFAPVVRAPIRLVRELAAIPGVAAVEDRVTGAALIDLDGHDLPLQARAVSLPDFGEPRLNRIRVTDGRGLDGGRADEVLLLHSFARAHGLRPGDGFAATMNGARRSLTVVGLAEAPEFLYTTAPGEVVPDDGRFAVMWMRRGALAAAYDLDGAFNEALLRLARRVDLEAVIDAADKTLAGFGGLGAYGLEDQASNRFVTEEIDGLRGTSIAVPPIFLAVAAFLLYVVLSRVVQSEREQIGLLKAFGYTDLEVGAHYGQLVVAIAAAGALAGCLMGIAAGRAMTGFYLGYFKFPFLIFELDPQAFVIGFAVSVVAASLGGFLVLRGVVALSPAIAMRPPAPADYSRIGRFGRGFVAVLDQPSRMVVRRLVRQPGRAAGAVLGIATGMALSVSMLGIIASFDRTLELSFDVIDRSDLGVTFTAPVAHGIIFNLGSLEGVLDIEPVRVVPAVLTNGLKRYRGALSGLVETPRLYRAIRADTSAIPVRRDGVVLSKALAGVLDIRAGEILTVEVREGRRPVLTVPVVAVAEVLLGAPAFMDLDALNRLMKEPGRVSGAFLRIDGAHSDRIHRALKGMPMVAGVSRKADARAALGRLMDTGAGAMRYVMAAIAAVITFGIVFNAARIAYAERARDLASLRVIGFTEGEAAFVLLGELAAITLMALPLGSVMGYHLTFAVSAGFSTDLYQIPAVFTPESYGVAALAVVGAALVSGLLVKRDLDRIDLVAALKTRE